MCLCAAPPPPDAGKAHQNAHAREAQSQTNGDADAEPVAFATENTLEADPDGISASSLCSADHRWRSRSDLHSLSVRPPPVLPAAAAAARSHEAPPLNERIRHTPDFAALRAVASALRPMRLQWQDLGCSYPRAAGEAVVLQVGLFVFFPRACGAQRPGLLLLTDSLMQAAIIRRHRHTSRYYPSPSPSPSPFSSVKDVSPVDGGDGRMGGIQAV